METTMSATVSAISGKQIEINWNLVFEAVRLVLKYILEFAKVLAWPTVFVWFFRSYKDSLLSFVKNRDWKARFPWGEIESKERMETQQADVKKREKNAERILNTKDELLATTKRFYEERIKQYEASDQTKQQIIKSLTEELTNRNLQLDFERTYNVIFGSQISLLRNLSLKGPRGDTREELVRFFVMVRRAWPSLQNWTLEQYLNFLLAKSLIEITPQQTYRLTSKGRVFLDYINSLGYPENKGL